MDNSCKSHSFKIFIFFCTLYEKHISWEMSSQNQEFTRQMRNEECANKMACKTKLEKSFLPRVSKVI